MNAYFVGITQQEKNNILDQHKKIYDGYRLIQQNNTEPQPLYVQDFANDKEGFVVNNKGDVKKYTNMGINESQEEFETMEMEMEEDDCVECGMKETYEDMDMSDGYAYRDDTIINPEADEIDFEDLDAASDFYDNLKSGKGQKPSDRLNEPSDDEEEDNNWMFVEDEFTENEDLDESFNTQRNKILEMFQRTSRF
jgi:hypothetical protein